MHLAPNRPGGLPHRPARKRTIYVRRRELSMFCGNNMGSLWIIIILILLFGCGGFGTCGCNGCDNNNCGCGC